MSNILSNPKQIVGINHLDCTFAIQNELTKAEGIDRNEPLNLHHNKFSRFPIVIIDKDSHPVSANISARDMISIIQKSKFLFNKELELSCTPNEESLDSLAYTVRFSSGEFKGKTPAEVLAENPDNTKKLNIQYEFLKKNLGKYPKNRIQMDAIIDAAKLLKANKLQKKMRKTISSFPIYASGLRPLVRRQRESSNGGVVSFVYQLWIHWNFEAEAPVCLEIENFWAPVIKTEIGLLNVKAENKESSRKLSINFTLEEWTWIMHEVESNIHIFELKYGSKAYDMANEAEKLKRESLKKKD